MNLWFVSGANSKSTRIIAKVKTEKEAFSEINKFLDEHNYKSYYIRIWNTEPHVKRYDVGSYTEFFDLELENGEEFEDRIKEQNEK